MSQSNAALQTETLDYFDRTGHHIAAILLRLMAEHMNEQNRIAIDPLSLSNGLGILVETLRNEMRFLAEFGLIAELKLDTSLKNVSEWFVNPSWQHHSTLTAIEVDSLRRKFCRLSGLDFVDLLRIPASKSDFRYLSL